MHSALITRTQLDTLFGRSALANRLTEIDIITSAFTSGVDRLQTLPAEFRHFSRTAHQVTDKITVTAIDETITSEFENYFLGFLGFRRIKNAASPTKQEIRRLELLRFLMESGLAVRHHSTYVAANGVPALKIDEGDLDPAIAAILAQFRRLSPELPAVYKAIDKEGYYRLLDVLQTQAWRRYKEAQLEFSFAPNIEDTLPLEKTGRELCNTSKGLLLPRKIGIAVLKGAGDAYANGLGTMLSEIAQAFDNSNRGPDHDRNLIIFDVGTLLSGIAVGQLEFGLG